MRKEISNWWLQAQNDLAKAEILFKSKSYDGVAFYTQQAVEKALKALIILKTKENIQGHSLVHLGKTANAPLELATPLKRLSPQYFLSRYPDASEEVPYELYDERVATEFLQTAKKVIEWTRKHLQ